MEVLNGMMYDFHSSEYLASDDFTRFLNEVKQSDVCQYLAEDIRNMTDFYCDHLFGGCLRRGLLATLTALGNQLRNEQKINNFTTRPYFPEPDVEGAVLAVRIVNQLTSKFKQGMSQLTQ